MAGTPNVTVLSGNRVEVRFDDVIVGMAQTLRANDDYGPQEVSGIGDIHVKEWVPSLARHTLTASVIQLKKESLESLGLATENGKAMLAGLVFDIAIVSKDAPYQVLRTYQGCSFASGDVEVTKHAIIIRNGTWMALDVVGTFI